jgi:hypothetical protein
MERCGAVQCGAGVVCPQLFDQGRRDDAVVQQAASEQRMSGQRQQYGQCVETGRGIGAARQGCGGGAACSSRAEALVGFYPSRSRLELWWKKQAPTMRVRLDGGDGPRFGHWLSGRETACMLCFGVWRVAALLRPGTQAEADKSQHAIRQARRLVSSRDRLKPRRS